MQEPQFCNSKDTDVRVGEGQGPGDGAPVGVENTVVLQEILLAVSLLDYRLFSTFVQKNKLRTPRVHWKAWFSTGG